jgi:2-(3-amino-3-carboxypropyl)histidine synthase
MVKTLFIDAKYKGEIELTKTALTYLKKYKSLAIYSSVQFSNLDKIISQLKGIKILISQPKRTSTKYQLLGCNVQKEDLNLKLKPEAFLYIGDGSFHPTALLFERKTKVIQYNPITKKHKVLTQKDIERILKKQQANLTKFHSSDNIGILVTLKPGQQRYNDSKILIKKYPNKNFYFFVDNNLDLNSLENFPFIGCWVNTACPRIGLDDSLNTEIKIINLSKII